MQSFYAFYFTHFLVQPMCQIVVFSVKVHFLGLAKGTFSSALIINESTRGNQFHPDESIYAFFSKTIK